LGIARNKLLRSLRRERTERSARRRLAVERIVVSDESLQALEMFRASGVLGLLEDLPEDQREAVRARIVDELGYDQLAASAGISPAAARKRVSRGLATLRRRVQQEGDK
jgi:RNA polymerase sigma-70 factor (ECF subfamily)